MAEPANGCERSGKGPRGLTVAKERIALNAPDRIREAALHTLAADATTRHVRMAEQFRMQAAPAAQRVQPLAPHKQRAIYTANNGTVFSGGKGDNSVDAVRVGLNWRFGAPAPVAVSPVSARY